MELKPFNPEGELDKQRRLFIECFPEREGQAVTTVEHYRWKFHSIPSKPSSYEYGAYEGDDLIGYYAAIPYLYVTGQQKLTAGMVCDVMTSVRARGKGVFTKLGKYSTDELKQSGVDFSIGYPIRLEVIPGHMKAGWEKMFPLPLYIKFFKLDSFLKQRNLGWLTPIANFGLWILNLPSLARSQGSKFTVSSYDSTDLESIDGLDRFFDVWIGQQEIALNKTTEFLKWRLSAPEKCYQIHVARWVNDIICYAITCNTDKEGVPCVAILDWSCLYGFEDGTNAILESIVSQAKRENREAILLMFSKHSAKRFRIAWKGFLKSPYKFWLIIKYLSDKVPTDCLINEKNWHLGWIDSDDL
jgi:hypothetical protein